jgi:Tol biopolymer transport system component
VGGSTAIALGIITVVIAWMGAQPEVCRFPEGFEFPEPQTSEATDSAVALTSDTLVSSFEWDVETDPSRQARVQQLFMVDTTNPHQAELLTKGPFQGRGAAPTISPDRQQLSFLMPIGRSRTPYIMDVMSGDVENFPRQQVCQTTQRVSWSASGSQLATLCTNRDGDAIKGVYVFARDTGNVRTLETPGIPDDRSAPTWIGDDALVYGQKPLSGDGAVTLWLFPSVSEENPVPVQLTTGGDGGSDTNPDWSSESGALLFLRSAPDSNSGAIWSCSADGGEQWGSADHFRAPTWSPDGKKLAFLIARERSNVTLAWSTFHDSDPEHAVELPREPELVGRPELRYNGKTFNVSDGTPTAPAWGSR